MASRRKGTAYHEAGHAVVSLYLGLPMNVVSIKHDAEDGSNGRFTHPNPYMLAIPATRTARRQAARDMMIGSYAGLEAQRLVDPNPAEFHGQSDDAGAEWLAREFGVQTDRAKLRREARQIVARLESFIDLLAAALLKRTTMTRDKVNALLHGMPTVYGQLGD